MQFCIPYKAKTIPGASIRGMLVLDLKGAEDNSGASWNFRRTTECRFVMFKRLNLPCKSV